MSLLRIDDLLRPGAQQTVQLFRQMETRYHQYLSQAAKATADANRPAGIHASEISHCMRQAAYTMLGQGKKAPASISDYESVRWHKKFEVGKAVHSMIQRHFHDMAKLSQYELSFSDEAEITPYTGDIAHRYQIYSSCDGVFTLRTRGADGILRDTARMALEIKTASPGTAAAITKPEADHVMQAHLYMACLDVPACWLLYYNKGNENHTGSDGPFLVVFDWSVWAVLESRMQEVTQRVAAKQLPEREEGMHCRFCKYSWVCRPPSMPGAAGDSNRGHR